MPQITLIGNQYAEVGRQFYYMGPMEECADCKYSKVCFNLVEGAKYAVTGIRLQEHECHEFDGDRVTVVEVEQVPTLATVGKRQALEGSKITFKGSECGNLSCAHYGACHPEGKTQGSKYLVSKVLGNVDCPLEEKLVFVELL